MSWQAYVDSSLVGSHNVDKAAIFNSEGNSVWATTAGFTVEPKEMAIAASAFQDGSEILANGLYIAGQKYVVLKADPRSIYAKLGKAGVILVKTKQAILVAHYPETVQPGTATTTVEQLADYLISVNY